ncbi:MAG: flagellar hook-basal body complex protein FliE [Burkholderiales bacterium]|nr:flagellar hook-basal body complex protein FliE [Burkholderiales bacterium]
MELNGIDAMLSQLQAASSAASGKAPEPRSGGADFASVLKNSIDQVNATQKQSENMVKSMETGSSSANLTEVMLSLQKANLSFQEMVQVRNRLVTAYNDIMNMQV